MLFTQGKKLLLFTLVALIFRGGGECFQVFSYTIPDAYQFCFTFYLMRASTSRKRVFFSVSLKKIVFRNT